MKSGRAWTGLESALSPSLLVGLVWVFNRVFGANFGLWCGVAAALCGVLLPRPSIGWSDGPPRVLARPHDFHRSCSSMLRGNNCKMTPHDRALQFSAKKPHHGLLAPQQTVKPRLVHWLSALDPGCGREAAPAVGGSASCIQPPPMPLKASSCLHRGDSSHAAPLRVPPAMRLHGPRTCMPLLFSLTITALCRDCNA